jgi:hypothetical protein
MRRHVNWKIAWERAAARATVKLAAHQPNRLVAIIANVKTYYDVLTAHQLDLLWPIRVDSERPLGSCSINFICGE